jgi:hypothetical protein
MKSWYSVSELAGLPGLPSTDRAIQIRAKREGWEHRPRQGRGGGKEYAIHSLPVETQQALAPVAIEQPPTSSIITAADRCTVVRWRRTFGCWLIRLGQSLLREEV